MFTLSDLTFRFTHLRHVDDGGGGGDEQYGTDAENGRGEFVRAGSDDESGEENIDQSGLEENHPAEAHELVVAETWNGPAHEDKEQNEGDHFGEENAKMNEAANL